MDNMIRYLDWRGDLSFENAPFCAVDLLIFSEFVHAPIELLRGRTGTLAELRDALFPIADDASSTLLRDRAVLWRAAAEVPRYRPVRLVWFDSCFDQEKETQFAAALFTVGRTAVVAFRGTDGTLVGWKEDFNMSYERDVPAQRLAAVFLWSAAEHLADCGCDRLIVCGHSKGGNLAMYAAAAGNEAVRSSLQAVYAFDAPGLGDHVLASEGWAAVRERVHLYIPESSVIGLLLGNPGEKTIVASDSTGIMQHNPFNWHVTGDHFDTVKETSASSRFIEKALQDYIRKVPTEMRKNLVNALFSIINKSGARTLKEVPRALMMPSAPVREVLSTLTDKERGLFTKLLLAFTLGDKSSLSSSDPDHHSS